MYNTQSKKSIYKWRETNKDTYNEYMNTKMKAYYQANKEKCNAKRVSYAKYKRECCRLCHILL